VLTLSLGLGYEGKLSNKEIAQRLGCVESNVRDIFQRAMNASALRYCAAPLSHQYPLGGTFHRGDYPWNPHQQQSCTKPSHAR